MSSKDESNASSHGGENKFVVGSSALMTHPVGIDVICVLPMGTCAILSYAW